ncbi:ribonucleoside-diphosphate reductase large subunit [Campylobacter phage CPX]|uniref:Ribonucleoside-diphosphate reductase n=2 Tax=Fletchervirus TaxID=1636618 RepID=G8GJ08_9CAUD|nr:ribonucleoside-diphosphate reductase large subunit [Campylobacter phage CPX]AET34393.1 ribonucleotide reductase large subunit [Campylobacter phage CPX]AGS81266.1 ribonucleotide reductase large subunit [Campylobacter phage CP8]
MEMEMLPVKSLTELDDININVVKRNGTVEKYSPDKMYKFLLKVCDNKELYAMNILSKSKIKLRDNIKIQDLYDEILSTTVNEISMLYPMYEKFAAKLYIIKYRKNIGDEISLSSVLKLGLLSGVYSSDFVNSFSEDEIQELDKYIDNDRDYLFQNYKAISMFYTKYCLNRTKTIKLETPQITYMRVAMFICMNESNRVEKIKRIYDLISTHKFTYATPIMLNSGINKGQLSSCVLAKMGDDSHSILATNDNLAIYSKNKGGTACDVSALRATGSIIDGVGVSSGPIPFIKLLDSTISAWNQGSTRKGSCCVYYPTWHMDVQNLIMLKDNGGTESTRARNLQYAIKIDDVFVKRWYNNENYTLFDPKDTQKLLDSFGDDFEKCYLEYEQKSNIRKKSINARELFDEILKYRVETGNIYIFFTDNVNKQGMLNRTVTQSNLCCEIVLPTSAPYKKDEKIVHYM